MAEYVGCKARLRSGRLFLVLLPMAIAVFQLQAQSPPIAQQPSSTAQQPSFAVAVIRPSAAPMPFVHDGKTDLAPDSLRMQDVTVATCIKWAYHVQDSQIVGPDWVRSDHFDITAKTDGPAAGGADEAHDEEPAGRALPAQLPCESRELKAYALVRTRAGAKLKPATVDGDSRIENSAIGFIAKSTTLQEFADYISDPMRSPVVDETGSPASTTSPSTSLRICPPTPTLCVPTSSAS